MRIKQIGNGDAFNHKMTNTSFLVEHKNEFILVDCGYSVFAKLRELDHHTTLSGVWGENKSSQLNDDPEFYLKNLNKVYITNMDDDHIGSLKTLIYYQFFTHNKIITIHAIGDVYSGLSEYLEDMNHVMMNGSYEPEELFYLDNCTPDLEGVETSHLPTDHGKPCYGIKFKDKEKERVVLISGDTKATMGFRREMKHALASGWELLAYHDYSNRNIEHSQVHACEEDFELLYHGFTDKIIKCHNNNSNDNNTGWV